MVRHGVAAVGHCGTAGVLCKIRRLRTPGILGGRRVSYSAVGHCSEGRANIDSINQDSELQPDAQKWQGGQGAICENWCLGQLQLGGWLAVL